MKENEYASSCSLLCSFKRNTTIPLAQSSLNCLKCRHRWRLFNPDGRCPLDATVGLIKKLLNCAGCVQTLTGVGRKKNGELHGTSIDFQHVNSCENVQWVTFKMNREAVRQRSSPCGLKQSRLGTFWTFAKLNRVVHLVFLPNRLSEKQ